MRIKNNNKGIALITVLIFSAISVAIVGALLYMLTSETKTSGMTRGYTEALEIAKGSSEYIMQSILQGTLTCNGGSICANTGDVIDLESYAQNINGYTVKAELTAPIIVEQAKTIYSIRVEASRAGSPEKAVIEFIYKVE